MIKEKVYSSIGNRRLSGNVVLVGGGAKMSGVIELASAIFGTQSVRIGMSSKISGLSDEYRSPDFTTAIGLVVANSDVLSKGNIKRNGKDYGSDKSGFLQKFINFFKEMF